MEYTRAIYFLIFCIIIMTVLVLFLFFPLLGLSAPSKEIQPTSSLTVLEHHGQIETHSGTYVVTGIAKNTGPTTIVKIYLVLTTFDANGSTLGSTYTAILNLNPGEKSEFRIEAWPYYNGYLISRYKIEPDYNLAPDMPGLTSYYVPQTGK